MTLDVTFIPGAAGLGSFWDPIAERLPPAWRKRSLDLPGLGPVPARRDVQSYTELADHVARTIDSPSVLVAQSMGGYVALLLALRYPERVERLVLAAAAGGVDMARHGARDWRPEDRAEDPARSAWVHATPDDLSSQLPQITVPVLAIWATRDPISPIGVAQELVELLPNARLISVDTDDHWVARHHPDETAQAIREFVKQPPIRL